MIQGIWKLFQHGADWTIGLWEQLLGYLNSIISASFNTLFASMPASVQDGSAFNIDLSEISTIEGGMAEGLWDGILWLVPISESILIVIGIYSIVASIRAIRWALGLIPTLSLGG